MSDPRTLVRRFYETFNAGDLDAYAELLDEEVEVEVDTATLRGREMVCAYAAGVRHTFPGIVAVPRRMVASEDGTVAVELRQTNPAGDDDPGTWRLAGTVCEVITVRDGEIAHVRSYYLPHPDDRTGVTRMPSRNEAYRLADEHVALRQVAALVAGGAAEREIFDAVNAAIARVLRADATSLFRFELDDTLTLVAAWSRRGVPLPIGERRAMDAQLRDMRARGEPRRFDTMPNDAPFVEEARDLGVRSAIGVPVAVEGRVWGVVIASSEGDAPFPEDTEARMVGFTELMATALANAQARSSVHHLVDEQAALRRVAELAARGAPSSQVLESVVEEACRLIGTTYTALGRFAPDGSQNLLATYNAPAAINVGDYQPLGAPCIMQEARRRGQPVRIDSYVGRPPVEWEAACELGVTAAAGAPILVDGEIWGALSGLMIGGTIPVGAEDRLAKFAELAGTAVSSAQARSELQQLADEQAALRRVAELVARAVGPEEVLDAVVVEASNLLGGARMSLLRFQDDGDAVVVATHREPSPIGLVVPTTGAPWSAEALRTRRALRVRSFENTPAEDLAREHDVAAVVVAPIVVEGRVWGMLSTGAASGEIPPGTEERLTQFAELAGTAVANAESRAQLTASRARVVAAADESRRRLQRDVHDGAQQRLVQTIINLKLARQALQEHPWPAAHLIDESLLHAERANTELRDLVHGILPASLTRGGLRAGFESLCAGLPIQVELHVTAPRLPAQIETTAYFVVAEALANVVKHAQAVAAKVTATADGGVLRLEVSDNGVGGADPARGSGLTGLLDRVEAGEGTLEVESPPGHGTTLRVTLPLAG